MRFEERALNFACGGDKLVGVVSVPEQAHPRGVLVVVGGPQYRAGSHRQFTLLARHLAAVGIAAMRFDYRGMGDSAGETRNFEDAGADIDAALTRFMDEVPGLCEVVIWGLCDGASAALLHAPRDARVTGLVLLNPWAHTEQGHAKTVLKHYYWARLREPAFWRKLASGRFKPGQAMASLASLVQKARGQGDDTTVDTPLPQRLHAALKAYRGRLLLLTCDADLTAQEFLGVAAAPEWRALLHAPTVSHRRLADADHTCSRREWRDQVAAWTADWVRSW